ncbi:hypothetical protein D3C75_909530 [compost metagenome]
MISWLIALLVLPTSARNFWAKSYSSWALPTKSNTVQHSLSLASRRPRPNCCKKMVRLSVGRKNSKVSTSGISTPSLKMSTTQRILITPVRKSCCLLCRSSRLSLVRMSALMPFNKNALHIKSACSRLTQNASALILVISVTIS